MAVGITRVADPAGVSSSSNVATYSGVSIGTAAEDRIVVLSVVSELTSASPNSATIDGVAMTAQAATGNLGAVYARNFYIHWPTGTTATFEVTFGANASSTQNHVIVHRVVGSDPVPTAQGGDGSTDMDVTDPLTTGSVTIPTNGGFVGIAAGATDTVAKTWANATEDLDADGGGLRYTNAIRTTAGTVTITVTGGTNNEDGALAWLIFKPGTSVAANSGSYAITGTAATLVKVIPPVPLNAGSYAVTGTAATLRRALILVADPADVEGWDEALWDAGVWDDAGYRIFGTDATLNYAAASRTITADAGAYSLSGTDATLRHAWVVGAGSGSYAVTGQDATLRRALRTALDAGSYSVSGTATTFSRTWRVAADAGSYAITGQDATLRRALKLTADGSSYAIVGTDATLVYTPFGATILGLDGGSYSVTGTDATFARTRQIVGDAGAYVLSGTDATLSKTTIAAEQPIFDPDGASRFEKGKRKAEAERQRWEEKRREAVENAFEKVFGEPVAETQPIKVTGKQRSSAAFIARQQLDAEGVRTSMREIRRLFDEYAAAVEAERLTQIKNHNDAIALLLMVA